MSVIFMDSKKIVQIRNALQIIQGNAEFLVDEPYINEPKRIIEQAKRIRKLLPDVKFEPTAKLKLPGTGPDHLHNDEITRHKLRSQDD